jgi:hypothetical protein
MLSGTPNSDIVKIFLNGDVCANREVEFDGSCHAPNVRMIGARCKKKIAFRVILCALNENES